MPPRSWLIRVPSKGWRVARLFGIDLRVHPSWFFSLAILGVTARSWLVADAAPHASPVPAFGLSLAFALAIVSCIVLHELAHSLVAIGHGLPVRTITLFAFGGVSQIEAEATAPAAEYRVALAGPLMSILLAALFTGVGRALHPDGSGFAGAWGTMGFINLILAIFNLFPAFPMDGGRILRSALWARIRSRSRATRWAAVAGRVIACVVIGTGFIEFARGAVSHSSETAFGAYSLLIGLFMYNATDSASRNEGSEHPNEPPIA